MVTFKDIVIIKEIAHGMMGTVYLVQDKIMGVLNEKRCTPKEFIA